MRVLIPTDAFPPVCGGSGWSSASRSQVNAIFTSVCQLTENVSHVWCCSGRMSGVAPATRTTISGA